MNWLKNIKALWGIIVLLITGIVILIGWLNSVDPELNRLRYENMQQDSTIAYLKQQKESYEFRMREWKWKIEDALKHGNLIYFDAGILKVKAEE